MRLSPGKESCHVIDMIGILNRGVISTPTLFGLNPFTIVDNATPENMEKMNEERGPGILLEGDLDRPNLMEKLWDMPIKHVLFTDYESIWDLLRDTSHEQQVRQISKYAWVKVGDCDYVLSATGMTLRVFRQQDSGKIVCNSSAV